MNTKPTKRNSSKYLDFGHHLGRLYTSRTEKPWNVSSKAFSCGLPTCTCTPCLDQRAVPVGESGLATLPHRNTLVHVLATGYANSRWKHHRSAKIFLPAGRQLAERLTLQGSPAVLCFLRCFMLSGTVRGKGWEKSVGWVFWVGTMYLRGWRLLGYRKHRKISMWK